MLKGLINKAMVMIVTTATLCGIWVGGIACPVYAGMGDNPMKCGPFEVRLSETVKFVKSVKATAAITDYQYYYDVTKNGPATFSWDNIQGSKSTSTGSEYMINTPGKHVLYIYVDRTTSDPLYGKIVFNVNNIDNSAPRMGSIKADINEGRWKVTIDGCSDDKTSGDKIKFLCLSQSQAAPYYSGGGLDENAVASAGGWSSNMTYDLSEGSYYFYAKDEAGNVTERSFDTGHIDAEPPYFTSEPELENEGDVSGFAKAVLVRVGAGDDGDGLSDYPFSFNNGETWQQGNQMRVVENGCINILLKDRMGNLSETKTVEIRNIDNTAPYVSVSEQESSANDGSVVINVSASDDMSGVSEISYSNDEVGIPVVIAGGDGTGSGSLQSAVTINSNGSYTFTAKDIMGNSSSERINVVKAVKTEYKDVTKDKDSNRDKDSEKDKDKDDKKDKNKDSDRDKSKDSESRDKKETKIINPGSNTGNGNNGGNNGNSNYIESGSDKKIIITEGGGSSNTGSSNAGSSNTGSSRTGNSNENSSDNSTDAAKSTKSGSAVSSNTGGGIKSSKSLTSGSGRYELLGEDDEDSEKAEDTEAESSTEEETTELKEVTLDEYLAAAPENSAHEEEIVPDLMEEDNEAGKKKAGHAGKIAMVVIILLLLTALTVFLLIKKGLISLPDNDDEDEDCDAETGVLGLADRIAGVFKKNLT